MDNVLCNSVQSVVKNRGFTLVELLIVVSILGILAAIVLPEFQDHTKQAKESQVRSNLKVLREAIERYAIEHNGVPPGYPLNNAAGTPDMLTFNLQMVFKASNAAGQLADFGTAGYPYGPYLPEVPANPFNGKKTVRIINNSTSFPAAPYDQDGWLYKPATKEIRLDSSNLDSSSKSYFTY